MAESAKQEDPVISECMTAIKSADYDAIEGLRSKIKPAHVTALVAKWNKSLSWDEKDAFIALLMDQSGKTVSALMEDGLNSPTTESRAYAVCALSNDPKLFDSLLDKSGWINESKVNAAVAKYKKEKK